MTFRIVLGIAIAAASVLTFFFLWGAADGSLYDDLGFSFFFVALAWAIVGFGIALKRSGHIAPALVLLMFLVFPATLYGLMILLFVLSGESWR